MSQQVFASHNSKLLSLRDCLDGRSWSALLSIRYHIFFNKYHFVAHCAQRVRIDMFAFEGSLDEQAK